MNQLQSYFFQEMTVDLLIDGVKQIQNAVRLIEILLFAEVSFKTADCGSHRCYPYPRLKILYYFL